MKNFKHEITGICLLSSLFITGCQPKAENRDVKPNVIVILSDDNGYGDMRCHGNPWIITPNMDQLYSESVRFTDHHTATTSSPTRAGIMTGKYNNKVGVWHTIKGRHFLSSEEMAMPKFFKLAGYRTGLFGKWHLGDNYPHRPMDFGFDVTVIHKGGVITDAPDYWENDYFDDTYFRNGEPEKFEGYCTDIWFAEAEKFMLENKNNPFLCVIPTNACHGPFAVDEKYSNLYKDNPDVPNPNFYGMVTNLDENLGKLRKFLKDNKLDKNTILVFMNDNGTDGLVRKGKEFIGYNAGMRDIKGSVYEGGHRGFFFIHWKKGGISKGRDVSHITSMIDVLPTLLDLAGIQKPSDVTFDGISLKPLIYNEAENWPDRTLFVDTQREDFLIKWKDFAVMTEDWRLVNKTELYDIKQDPGQKNNIAEQHPDVVAKLLEAYDEWWDDVSANAHKYNRTIIGTENENPVMMTTHDVHAEKGLTPYCQHMVRLATGANGFWAVEFAKDGKYEIELCRWPKESNLRMCDPAPESRSDTPRGEPCNLQFPYPAGKALNIVKAKIILGDNSFEKEVFPTDFSANFTIDIEKGQYNMDCFLIDSEGVERSSYYVYINCLEL